VACSEPLTFPFPRGVRIASNTKASVAAIVTPRDRFRRFRNISEIISDAFLCYGHHVRTPSRTAAAEPKQARAHATRRRLLDAAVEELLERGYVGLTTPAVARRAGVSRGAQQNYFPHKATLVAEAVRHLALRQIGELRERVAEVPSGQARVQAGLDILFEQYSGPL